MKTEHFKDNEVYICKMTYPIANKHFRVVGLGGKVQEAFFKLFNTDMLLLQDSEEVDNKLNEVYEYLKRNK